MNFSVAFSTTSANLVCWSPSGHYLAVADNNKVYIKDGQTANSLITTYTCYDTIKLMQWSPDSTMLMTATPSNSTSGSAADRPCAEVWSMKQPDWRCKIELGSAGLLTASWAPDSRHVVTTDLLYVGISVWSLVNKSVASIKNPKEANPGLQFSCDGSYLAVAERINCKDHLTILETQTWQLVKQFPVSTRDLAGLAWGCGGDSGTGTIIAVWDSVLAYNVTLYAMCGRVLSSIQGSESHGLGVRGAVWTPSGHHLLMGGQDTRLRVMCHMTWKIISERAHSPIIEGGATPVTSTTTLAATSNRPTLRSSSRDLCDSRVTTTGDDSSGGGGGGAVPEYERVRVFREISREVALSSCLPRAAAIPVVARETAYEEEMSRPIHLAVALTATPFTSVGITPCLHYTPGGFSPHSAGGRGLVSVIENGAIAGGVTAMLLSVDGRYLATRVQQLPTVVWVWSVPRLTLVSVLVHNSAVRDLSWSPRHPRLAVCTGDETLFLWTSYGSLTVTAPPPLRMTFTALRWHPSGNRLLLVGRGGLFCVCNVGGYAQHVDEARQTAAAAQTVEASQAASGSCTMMSQHLALAVSS